MARLGIEGCLGSVWMPIVAARGSCSLFVGGVRRWLGSDVATGMAGLRTFLGSTISVGTRPEELGRLVSRAPRERADDLLISDGETIGGGGGGGGGGGTCVNVGDRISTCGIFTTEGRREENFAI